MNDNDNLLAAAPVPKAFFKLAVPAVAAQLINILYNLVDKMFIGHIPEVGKQALAGVGVTTPVILAISAFAALVSMGGAPKASIFLGKGEKEQAEKVMGSCTWMLFLLSILLTAVMLVFGRPILLLFGASEDTISFAADYMNIYCLGTLFTQLTLGLNAFITAQGKTLISMRNVAVGAATNILLDALLINGFHMGVRGAALATILSQGVSACFVIRYLCTEKSLLCLHFRDIRFDGGATLAVHPAGYLSGADAADGESGSHQLQHLAAKIRRRHGRFLYEYSEQCDAVRYAASAGAGTGRAAAAELQSGIKEHSPCEENLPAAAHLLRQRIVPDLAAVHDCARCRSVDLHQ